jgi:N-acetylglucosaminyl-diphospho-decaprenol L-rhamnosyltransferase
VGERAVGEWAASVVIPAHNEEFALPRLLEALLEQELGGLRLEVAVVVNGSTDATAIVASHLVDRFATDGHRLAVTEIPTASKAEALNRGDREVTAFPRLYLDADIRLSPNAIRRTIEELASTDSPMLAAPRVQVADSGSPITRRYGRVWSELPYLRSHVPGVGFYAVNEAGRRRWWRFPTRIGADDKFVRLHFGQDESLVIEDASFTVFLPEQLGELLRVRGRWTSLNREIVRHCPGLHQRDDSRWMSSARHLANNSEAWPDVPAFLAVWSCAWGFSLLRTAGVGQRWSRASSSPMRTRVDTSDGGLPSPAAPTSVSSANGRARLPTPPARTVHAVIVTYNSSDTAPRCIERLLASEGLDELRVTVVDNASPDGGAPALAARYPELEVVTNEVNVGFSAAVNQAVADSDSQWIAVINPDVEIHVDTLAASLDHLERHPAVGSCGVPAVHSDGSVNDRSFFMRPTGWSEITLALGTHRLAPASRLLNPEQSLAHQHSDAPRGVDVIAGCFNVLDRELFEHLRGYDEDYFLCGEDFDLSVRAVQAGAAPEVVPLPPILHHSEGSFSSSADARVAYLRGRAQYQRRWWPPRRAAFAGLIRRGSILGRLIVLRLVRSGRGDDLAHLWARREEWTDVAGANA